MSTQVLSEGKDGWFMVGELRLHMRPGEGGDSDSRACCVEGDLLRCWKNTEDAAKKENQKDATNDEEEEATGKEDPEDTATDERIARRICF
ncbi:hypothetical protein K438DRAFT_1985285 [Mycena galopus ATCC 62051]|nr:hypothetical protein K438DRAFT_1985285 [Mycena galopus ATCC 62051]